MPLVPGPSSSFHLLPSYPLRCTCPPPRHRLTSSSSPVFRGQWVPTSSGLFICQWLFVWQFYRGQHSEDEFLTHVVDVIDARYSEPYPPDYRQQHSSLPPKYESGTSASLSIVSSDLRWAELHQIQTASASGSARLAFYEACRLHGHEMSLCLLRVFWHQHKFYTKKLNLSYLRIVLWIKEERNIPVDMRWWHSLTEHDHHLRRKRQTQAPCKRHVTFWNEKQICGSQEKVSFSFLMWQFLDYRIPL